MPFKRQSSLNTKIHSRNSDTTRFVRNYPKEFDQLQVEEFDTAHASKRKKNFSIYDISNKLFESGLMFEDISKQDVRKSLQNKVKMTPSKRQIDDICQPAEGTLDDSRPSLSRPSLLKGSIQNRDSNLLSQKNAENEITNRRSAFFESPGNRKKSGSKAQRHSSQSDPRVSIHQKMPSTQLNPIESPDPSSIQVLNQKPISIRTRFQENDQAIKLRTTRINEVINENSEFESQQNNVLDKIESPSDLGFLHQQPLSARTPAMHPREYPLLYRSNSITKIVDLQRKSFDIINKHHFHSFFGKNAENEEIQYLRKQLREQTAEFIKQKALLEQQVQLLTQQLSIESERCKNLKKNYTAALQAFKQKKNNSSDSNSPRQRRKNGRSSQSPGYTQNSRQLVHEELMGSFSGKEMNRNRSLILNNIQYKPDPWSAKKIEILQKDNKDLQMTIKRLEELIQTTKEQSKTQAGMMYQKEQDIVQLRANIIDYETKLKSNAESRIHTISKIENKQVQRLEQEIKNLKADQERQISKGIEEYQARNVLLNDQIIDYQTQIKHFNNEINSHMARLNMKEQSFRALEQQVHIYENQIQTINRDHQKEVDEYEGKISTLEKEVQRLSNVLRQLKDQCQKDNTQQNKIPKKFTQLINSSVDNMFCQSNNVTEHNVAQPEETIKFVSSANNSTNQFETSIQQDRESNLNGQRNIILTTDALVNTSTIPVDKILSDLSKSHMEIQACVAQVHIQSKEKRQKCKYISVSKFDANDQSKQIGHELDVLRDDQGQSLELKDRNGNGISPIVHGGKPRRGFAEAMQDQEIVDGQSRQGGLWLKQQKSGSKGLGPTASCSSPPLDQKPLKLSSYWANDDNFKDDGTCSLENVNGLRRLVANMRSRKNKLVIKFNNLKSDSLKEIKRLESKIAQLKDELQKEKDKRVDVQIQKIEQSSALYETINEKASKINRLKQQLNDVESEREELQSLGQTYLGFGARLSLDQEDRDDYQTAMKSLYRTDGRDVEPNVYQSQQLYNLKGLQKSTKRHSNRSMSAKRNSVNGSLSLKSLNQAGISGFRKQMLDNGGNGSQTQRQTTTESKQQRTLSRYLAGHPRFDMPDMFPQSPEIQSPRKNSKFGQYALKNISSLQAVGIHDEYKQNERLAAGFESSQQVSGKVSPSDTNNVKVQGRDVKSPPSFIQHSHLQQSKTLTMKSLDSQGTNRLKNKKLKQSASNVFNNTEISLITNLNKGKKPILAKTKTEQNILDASEVQCGCAPQMNLLCKSPNMKSYDQFEALPPQEMIDYTKVNVSTIKPPLTDRDRNLLLSPTETRGRDDHNSGFNKETINETEAFDNGYDSQVNMMSPTHHQKHSFESKLRQSVKNMQHGIAPRGNYIEQKVKKTSKDQASNDSEEDLDVGQETQSGHQSMLKTAMFSRSDMSNQIEAIPTLNLHLVKSANNASQHMQAQPSNISQKKGMFYAEMNKRKANQFQSPSSNYKRFLTQNSQQKINMNSQQSLHNPQIIQRPKIQNYLTQNLPSRAAIQSDRKEKNMYQDQLSNNRSTKNIASKSSKNLNNDNGAMEENTVYTAKVDSKVFTSPRNTVNNSLNQQNEASIKCEQQYYKASTYLSSQKLTPNMQSGVQSGSNSHRQGGTVKKSGSNTQLASTRGLNSFFSQASHIGTNMGPCSTPNNKQQTRGMHPIEEGQYRLVTSETKAKGQLSGRGSNASCHSNISQGFKQPNSMSSRQSTAQQMYQAYKNKYLVKK